jgi:Flp pilus assembly protein TadD
VPKIEYPDKHYLNAAAGWLELSVPDEAEAELAKISAKAARHPDALELQWRLHAARNAWEEALETAEAVTRAAPDRPSGWIHQSYSLHELRRTSEAKEVLVPVANKFPKEFVIPYNLACYACALGDLEDAQSWLQRALKIKGKEGREEFKRMALADPDLIPIRDYILSL